MRAIESACGRRIAHAGTRRPERAQRLIEDFRLVGVGLHNSENDAELALRDYSWGEIAAAAEIDRGLWTYLASRAAPRALAADAPGREPTPAPQGVARATQAPAGPAMPPARPARPRRGGVKV